MREIRLSGSVRGVRRKLYPYRDTLPADAVGSVSLWDAGSCAARVPEPMPARAARYFWPSAVAHSMSKAFTNVEPGRGEKFPELERSRSKRQLCGLISA